MPIKILASQVVSQIAAGEVVERPASVVKELIENSLDADSSQITIEIQGGGVSLIKVSDNGAGIPADEVEIAFTRHATSKIDAVPDLEKISTLGFRGEALPSIAAVAGVEIITQAADEIAASYLRFENGSLTQKEKRSRPPGTTITVHHLFRQFPARLKFLKSTTTENGHITNLITQYALAFPEVKFNLSVDGRATLNTPGNGNLRDTVVEANSLEVAREMLEINGTEQEYTVSGMVSPASLSRSSRNYLSFFVNRRWVRSSLLTRATEDAYHNLLMVGKHPIAIINISLSPKEIDVNVHPTKTEIKFLNSQIAYTAVKKAISEVLAYTPPPEIKTGVPPPPSLSLWTTEIEGKITSPLTSPFPDSWTSQGSERNALPILRVVGQLSNSYIITEGPEGLYLIDQHAAHERILFEKILAQRSQQNIEVQGLLDPLNIELSPEEEQILNSKREILLQFGISLEHFGGRSYLLRTVPSVIIEGNLTEAIKAMLNSLTGDEEPAKREEKIAQSLACHGAVKAGDSLTLEEMRSLIRQLEQADQPKTCPHGRPTMIHLSSHQLAQEFGRR